ncbi:MAG: hypothetical protein LBQ42_13035 [Synergistaceae bacterium]|jgi:hypothetical protein|nr:hypothetical protein [Synergistaceae bacterium]
MKIKKSFLVLAMAIFCVGLLARYAFRDIRLDVDLLRESLERMPGLVLENLEFEREISGDLWRVRVPLVERRDDKIEVRSVDVRRLTDGREWYFWGARGFYSEKAESADLLSLLGTLETDTRVLNLESPWLSWSRDENEFLFPRGLTIYDAEFILQSDAASVDASGTVLLGKGGVIRWRKAPE